MCLSPVCLPSAHAALHHFVQSQKFCLLGFKFFMLLCPVAHSCLMLCCLQKSCTLGGSDYLGEPRGGASLMDAIAAAFPSLVSKSSFAQKAKASCVGSLKNRGTPSCCACGLPWQSPFTTLQARAVCATCSGGTCLCAIWCITHHKSWNSTC